ncbi:MAG: tRNA lysidine(34) synthetase TilS [Clostridiales bacterium]|jgi:tRNA(Ile)-lysidine synthase|nr:tRNA lysidine(34) synthetase TilS [Clostridiales bacterium]
MYKKVSDILRLKVIKTIEGHNLLNGANRVMVGFSGGADSSVLLDVLLSLRKRYGFEVSAVHINHKIRGKESDSDEEFVRQVCRNRGITLFVEQIDVPALAKVSKASLELAAREARYSTFFDIAEKNSIDLIATAHNANDNAETAIFNLVRGSALKGLCGIPYKRGKIIRPLLDVTREEIEDYATEKGISYVTDSTNSEDLYTRNKIRHTVLPVLKEINPSFINAFTRQSVLFEKINEYLTGQAKEISGDISEKDEVLILQYIYNNCPEFLDMETAEKISKAVREKTNRKFAVSRNLYAVTDSGSVNFRSHPENNGEFIEYTRLSTGKNILAGGKVVIYYNNSPKNFNHINKNSTTITLRSDIINGAVFVRPRNSGDTLRLNGITKSIKKEFINKKIPLKYRGLIPIICAENEIIGVPFIGIADKYKPTTDKRDIFTIVFDFQYNVKTEKDGDSV